MKALNYVTTSILFATQIASITQAAPTPPKSAWGTRGLNCSVAMVATSDNKLEAALTAISDSLCEPIARLEYAALTKIDENVKIPSNESGLIPTLPNSVEIQEVSLVFVPKTNRMGYVLRSFVDFNDISYVQSGQIKSQAATYISGVVDSNLKTFLGSTAQITTLPISSEAVNKLECGLASPIHIGNDQVVSKFEISATSDLLAARDLTVIDESGSKTVVSGGCTADFANNSLKCVDENFSFHIDISRLRTDVANEIIGILSNLAGGPGSTTKEYFMAQSKKKWSLGSTKGICRISN